MALFPSNAWYQAVCRDGAKIRLLVDLYDGTTHYQAATGSMDSGSDLAGTPAVVHRVSPVGVTLDPFTREVDMGELYIDVADHWFRTIFLATRLAKQQCTVKVGAAELDESDFVSYFVGQMESFEPDPDNQTSRIVLLSPFAMLDNTDITGYWINVHLLEALYDGAGGGILEKGGATSFTTASFDPTDAAYDDIEHLLFTRGHTYGLGAFSAVVKPTPALEVAQDACRLMNGHLVVDEAGALEFKRFNATTAASDSWTEDDFLPGSFKQHELDRNIINRIIINFGRTGPGEYTQIYQADETGSQSAFAYPGESERILSRSFDTPWIDRKMHPRSTISDSDTSLILYGPAAHYSGNKSGLTIDASHPVYLLLDSSHTPEVNNVEIVKATALARDTGIMMGEDIWDPETETHNSEGPFCAHLTYSSITRAQLGTSASRHHGGGDSRGHLAYVYDITALVLLCDELLARFGYGCPLVSVETLLTKYEYQIGDMINLTYDRFLAYGMDGLSADKFEIVGKEFDLFANPPRIKWDLAYAGTNAVTRTGRSGFGLQNFTTSFLSAMNGLKVFDPYVASGFGYSLVSGRVAKIEAGTGTNGVTTKTLANDYQYTFPASKDTYVTFDLNEGTAPIFQSVANGAAQPDFMSGEVPLWKVVTDATSITSTEDMRSYEPIPSRIVSGESQRQIYNEEFATLPTEWKYQAGSSDNVALKSTGQTGGKALECSSEIWAVSTKKVPFDPEKLYRMRVGVRVTQRDSGPTTSKEKFYCGVVGIAANGYSLVNSVGAASYASQHYIAASDEHVFGDAGLNTWITYYGWFKGTAATGDTTPSTDATSPQVLHDDVRYIRPVFIANYDDGDGKMEIDFIDIDAHDEDAIDRVYNAINASASSYTVASDKVETASIQDDAVAPNRIAGKLDKYGMVRNAALAVYEDG